MPGPALPGHPEALCAQGAPHRDTSSPTPRLGASPSAAVPRHQRPVPVDGPAAPHRRPLVRDGLMSGPRPAGPQGTGTRRGTGPQGPAREERRPGRPSAGPCRTPSGDRSLSRREDRAPSLGGRALYSLHPAPSVRGLHCPERKPAGLLVPGLHRGLWGTGALQQTGGGQTSPRSASGKCGGIPPSWPKGTLRSEPVCLPPSWALVLTSPRQGFRGVLDVDPTRPTLCSPLTGPPRGQGRGRPRAQIRVHPTPREGRAEVWSRLKSEKPPRRWVTVKSPKSFLHRTSDVTKHRAFISPVEKPSSPRPNLSFPRATE